ncbi:MAG: hypothetical protein MJ252_11425 [archaeon]|nr:hypothetical protein [archaeon]
MNLVIKVKEGDITDIVWDNQCLGCESKNCVNDLKANNLYNLNEELTYSMCKADKIEEGFFDNDPKFYVTWFGTDKKGRQFKSSNLAFSKFKQYNTKSLYKAVGGSCGIIDTNKIYDGIVARDVNDILTKLNNTFTS